MEIEEYFKDHIDDFILLKENGLENIKKQEMFNFLFKEYHITLGFKNAFKRLSYFSNDIKNKFLKNNFDFYKNEILSLIKDFKYINEYQAFKFFLNDEIKTCPTCGVKHLKASSFCCNRCAQLSPEIKNKIRQTKFLHFGDENYNNMESIRKTKFEKYGNPGFTNREKCKKTVQERYGVDNIFQDREAIKRIKRTKLEKYGSENFNNRELAVKTCMEKYGCTNVFLSKEVKEKISSTNPNKFLNRHKDANKEFFEKNFIKNNRFLIKECCEYFGACTKTIQKIKEQFGITVKNKTYYRYSKKQQFIFDNIDFNDKDMNVHGLLDGNQEIDIFLGGLNIGIEYNGLFYHQLNENYFYREYKKFLCSEKHNIKLCQIYECDDIDLWLSKISHFVGKSKRIFARKCQVKELETNELRSFIDENSLDNFYKDNYGEKGFGLVYSGELLSVLSFTKNEINQICTKKGFCVVGGFSKLIKHFEKQCKNFVIKHNNKFGITNVFSKIGSFIRRKEFPSVYETKKLEFADCGKTIYIRTEQDE